jgi:dethiobiotin synthetase
MSFFVTGTDTGVGKTLISTALLHGFAAQGKRVAGFKPVAAGGDEAGVNEDVKLLRAVSSLALTVEQINPYYFPEAIAPHLAAQAANVTIDMEHIVTAYQLLAATVDELIVEGVGGFCVPLNDQHTTADLAKAINLPIILVVGLRLGCLNHALLTQQMIADYGLHCAGWVANGVTADMPFLTENIQALSDRLTTPLLGVVPFQLQPDAKIAASYLDLGKLK